MAKNIDWEAIRAEYETGASAASLAHKYGCSHTAINNKVKSQGWCRDVEDAIRRKVSEKVSGIVSGCNPKKKAEAMDAEASRRADVVQRHRDEWEEHKDIVDTAIGTKDFEAAKLAKITAETLKIRQEAERKAWAIDIQVAPVTNITISHQGPTATIEEIQEVLKGNMADSKV
jgi:hypothetical protein